MHPLLYLDCVMLQAPVRKGAGKMQSMRIGTLLAVAALAGGLSWAFGGFTSRFLFGVWGGTAAYAVLVWLLPTGSASVSRRMPQRLLHPGETLQVEVTVKSRTWLPVAWMAVTDRWVREQDGMSYAFRQLIGTSRWGERPAVSYSVSGLPRGTYRLAGTELVSGDLLGFVTKRRVLDAGGAAVRAEGRTSVPHKRECGSAKECFVVLPRAKMLTSIRLPVSMGPEERDTSRSKERFPRQQTTNGSVREYVAGDPLSRIHWKSTARMGQWMTRAEEPTEDLELWIALDAHESLQAGGPAMARRWEAAIERTAGMLREAMETQAKLGFLVNDRKRQQDDHTPDGDSGDHRPVHSGPTGGLTDWMQRLAGLKMDGSVRLGEMLLEEDGRLIRPGQALLCVATVISEELTEALMTLRLRGRSVGLIHMHECAAFPERERCRRLASLGCEVQVVSELGSDREVLPHVQYAGA